MPDNYKDLEELFKDAASRADGPPPPPADWVGMSSVLKESALIKTGAGAAKAGLLKAFVAQTLAVKTLVVSGLIGVAVTAGYLTLSTEETAELKEESATSSELANVSPTDKEEISHQLQNATSEKSSSSNLLEQNTNASSSNGIDRISESNTSPSSDRTLIETTHESSSQSTNQFNTTADENSVKNIETTNGKTGSVGKAVTSQGILGNGVAKNTERITKNADVGFEASTKNESSIPGSQLDRVTGESHVASNQRGVARDGETDIAALPESSKTTDFDEPSIRDENAIGSGHALETTEQQSTSNPKSSTDPLGVPTEKHANPIPVQLALSTETSSGTGESMDKPGNPSVGSNPSVPSKEEKGTIFTDRPETESSPSLDKVGSESTERGLSTINNTHAPPADEQLTGNDSNHDISQTDASDTSTIQGSVGELSADSLIASDSLKTFIDTTSNKAVGLIANSDASSMDSTQSNLSDSLIAQTESGVSAQQGSIAMPLEPKWMISPYFSIDRSSYAIDQVSLNNLSGSAYNLQLGGNGSTYSAGLRFAYRPAPNLWVESGFLYSRKSGISGLMELYNPGETFPSAVANYQLSGEFFEIPVLLGIRSNNGVFGWYFKAGAHLVYNVPSAQSYFEYYDFEVERLYTIKPSYQTLNPAISLSAGFEYNLSSNLRFFAEPNFRFANRPVLNTDEFNNIPVNPKWSTIGLGLGINYYFGK